jgi:hypothetical protein
MGIFATSSGMTPVNMDLSLAGWAAQAQSVRRVDLNLGTESSAAFYFRVSCKRESQRAWVGIRRPAPRTRSAARVRWTHTPTTTRLWAHSS